MTEDYQFPTRNCDIIMKGGITSGIVYPKAVLRLARTFRFRSVGGTSAGAIAAAITAAAEYGRASGGFDKLATIPQDMSQSLATLFQPDPRGAALFAVFSKGGLDGRWGAALWAVVRQHWRLSLAGVAGAGAATAWAALTAGWVAAVAVALLALLAVTLAIGWAFVRHALCLLSEIDYGLCPGRTQAGFQHPGLSDWLAETIERCAGRIDSRGKLPERPLTFGDLAGRPDGIDIQLRMVTTNLSMRRPHMLPELGDANYYFREEEFRRLFPDWVVDYMVTVGKPRDGYVSFPAPADLPVVVATRMSLSFPFLISAVPLHRRDFASGATTFAPRRLLFSDGGLSSNFPIHFFDAVLPGRPTFGISLDDWQGPESKRVRLPMRANSGHWLDIIDIRSVPAFVMALVNAAKDWQDRLQTVLPGYRERVAHVYLKPDEGGLNLTMPPERIDTLVALGERAAALLDGGPAGDPNDEFLFDFDDHRWRRFLIAYAAIEEALTDAAAEWGDPHGLDSFAAFIDTYMHQKPASYDRTTMTWREEVFNRFSALMAMGKDWSAAPLRDQTGAIPRPPTKLRIAPKM